MFNLIPRVLPNPNAFNIPLGMIGLWRITSILLRYIFWMLYSPKNPKSSEKKVAHYTSKDVTIIVPTIDTEEVLLTAAKSWIANNPKEIIIVTSYENKKPIEDLLAKTKRPDMFRVLAMKHPTKRYQLMMGVQQATSEIICFCDDDAVWKRTFLRWMLAPFNLDHQVGAVGSSQEMRPVDDNSVSMWEILADMRLTLRVIEASATTYVDGGISCLSGRTALYRREIVVDPKFAHKFVTETWRGKKLISGDDKFLTRWVVSHGWKMQFQNHPDATLSTTFRNNWTFIKQVLRWTRNTWRSDIRSMFMERFIWTAHPMVAYTMVEKCLNVFTLLWGVTSLFYEIIHESSFKRTVLPLIIWILCSRILKFIPHFFKNPHHICYIFHFIIFNYFFVFLKIYALFTLSNTDWGNRAIDDEDDDEEEIVGQEKFEVPPVYSDEEEEEKLLEYKEIGDEEAATAPLLKKKLEEPQRKNGCNPWKAMMCSFYMMLPLTITFGLFVLSRLYGFTLGFVPTPHARRVDQGILSVLHETDATKWNVVIPIPDPVHNSSVIIQTLADFDMKKYPDYIFTDPNHDNDTVLSCPVQAVAGGYASHDYPKVELQEINTWNFTGVHRMVVAEQILQVPIENSKVMIGQIFCNSLNFPILSLFWTDSKVSAQFQTTEKAWQFPEQRVGTDIALNSVFSFEIGMYNHMGFVSVNSIGGQVFDYSGHGLDLQDFSFRVGVDVQTKRARSDTDKGIVALQGVSLLHSN
jgi:cellulose synthase/poly-beta-1,6-N-acetylglucosamine synthase-like glycosyltransferase